jgi:hypothetical protein
LLLAHFRFLWFNPRDFINSMKTEKQLLQQILAGQVIILSKLIDAEKKATGTTRAFGDYTREAAKMITDPDSNAVKHLASL